MPDPSTPVASTPGPAPETTPVPAIPITTTFMVDGATYDLVKVPDSKSQPVINARAGVLLNLDLDKLVVNLERASDLIYVALCGVSGAPLPPSGGMSLSGRIVGLQNGLFSAASNSMMAMGKFSDASTEVLECLLVAFQKLYQFPPREDLALDELTSLAEQATTLATTAEGLSRDFQKLHGDADTAHQGTLTARDIRENERVAAELRKQDLVAKNARATALRDALVGQMKKMEDLIDEVRERLDKAEDRSFGLAIGGLVTGAISSGVSGFMAYKMAPMTAASNVATAFGGALGSSPGAVPPGGAPPGGSPPGGSPPGGSPPGGLAPGGSPPGGSPPGGAPPSSATSSNNQAAVAAAIASGSARATEGNQALASSYHDTAARYAAEKREYLRVLVEMQKEQREALAAIAQYAEEMKTADLSTAAAKSAVDCLQHAIGALSQIVTTLEDARVFWQTMGDRCRSLASSNQKRRIDRLKTDPVQTRVAEYARPEFKRQMLEVAWRWCALKSIADDYRSKTSATREKVRANIHKNPSVQDARRLASQLAAQLQLDVNSQIGALDATTAQLSAEMAQLPPPPAR